jgi:DNA-binding NarL/FixJ family response regulator
MDDPDIIVEAVRAGAKAYIKKPISGEEIKRRLSKLLKKGEE